MEDRHNRNRDDKKNPGSSDFSSSNSASLSTLISASNSATEMTSSKFFKFSRFEILRMRHFGIRHNLCIRNCCSSSEFLRRHESTSVAKWTVSPSFCALSMTDQMIREIMRHADPLWRNQRSTNARLLDPRNQDKMKRRRRELSTRTGTTSLRDGVAVKDGGIRAKDGKVLWKRMRTSEKERKNNFMKERDKLRIWDRGSGNQTRVQIVGDSNLVVNWMNGRWKINNQKFRVEVQKTQHLLDKTDIRPMADHLDLFQQITETGMKERIVSRMRQGKGVLAGTRSLWMKAQNCGCQSILWWRGQQATRSESKEQSGFGVRDPNVERIEEVAEKMEWRTITEVEKALDDDATVRLWRLPKPLVLGSTWPSHFWCGWKFRWGMGQKGRGSARRRTWRKDTKEDVTT